MEIEKLLGPADAEGQKKIAWLIEYFRQADRQQGERAKKAFDAMTLYFGEPPAPGYSLDDPAYKELIRENLDADSLGHFVKLVLADHARAKAYVRHGEHHAMRECVWAWCDAHMGNCRSVDAAAREVAGKVVCVAFTTARKWINKWPGIESWKAGKKNRRGPGG